MSARVYGAGGFTPQNLTQRLKVSSIFYIFLYTTCFCQAIRHLTIHSSMQLCPISQICALCLAFTRALAIVSSLVQVCGLDSCTLSLALQLALTWLLHLTAVPGPCTKQTAVINSACLECKLHMSNLQFIGCTLYHT